MSESHHRSHKGHRHDLKVDADARWLLLALSLIAVFMVAEVVSGLVGHSLALLSDAAHMLADVGALTLALVAMRFARRPAGGMYTYGFKRVEILSAQANGLTLLILSILLGVEAIRRLIHPSAVTGGLMLTVALVGVVINLVATGLVSRANRSSLNVEGAFRHLLTDLFGFVATAIAGVIVVTSQWSRADPIASLIIVGLMLRAGYGLVREAGRIFLEASPANVDPEALGASLAARPGVEEVHDLHVWEITSGMTAVSAHVIVEPKFDCHAVQHDLQRLLHDVHQIDHTTLQVEHRSDRSLQIETKPSRSNHPGHS